MDDRQIRRIVADKLETTHGNLEFVRQVRDGEQDDGPWMQAAFAVRDWVIEEMTQPQQEEVIDE